MKAFHGQNTTVYAQLDASNNQLDMSNNAIEALKDALFSADDTNCAWAKAQIFAIDSKFDCL